MHIITDYIEQYDAHIHKSFLSVINVLDFIERER